MKLIHWYASIFLIIFFKLSSVAGQSIVLQGRILNADGTPITSSDVQFRIQIKSPGAEDCLLFQESQSLDLSQTQGAFALTIGQGSRVNSNIDGGNSLSSIFSDSKPISLSSAPAACTSGATSYTPGANDTRRIEIIFNDGSGWESIPTIAMSWVPQSMYALDSGQLGGTNASQFLSVASGTTPSVLTATDYVNLNTLLSGTNTNYVRTSNLPICTAGQFVTAAAGGALSCQSVSGASGGTVTSVTSANSYLSVATTTTTPVLTLNVGTTANTVAAGNDARITGALQSGASAGGDLTGTYPNPSLATNSVTTTKINDQAVTASKIATGTITDTLISNSAAISDNKLSTISTAGKVSGSAITSGTISGTTAVSTSGNIVSSGTVQGATVSATHLTARDLQLYDNGINKITVQSPTTLTSSYNLTLPTAAPSANGYVLSSDTSGVLSWIAASTGSVTGVTATAPLVSSGGTTPNLTLAQANTTTNGYLSSTDWNTFNGKQNSSLTNGSLWIGNGTNVATAVAVSGDASLTNAGVVTVSGIRGKTVSSTAPSLVGQVYRYDGTSTWIPGFLSLADIRSTVTPGNTMFPSSTCTASQTLTWSSLTDTMVCTSISIDASALASGTLSASRLPSSVLVSGGNSLGAAVTMGTNDNYDLNFKTNNATSMTINTSGNVGVGTTNPGYKLDISGAVRINNSGSSTSGILFPATSATTMGVWANGNDINISPYYDGIFGPANSSGRLRPSSDNTSSLGTSSQRWSSLWVGTGTSSFAGNVGIGTTSPTHQITLPASSTGFAIYNTADQTTNYERFVGKWSSNTFLLGNEFGGTATSRVLQVGTAAVAGGINRTLNISGSPPFFSYTWSATGLAGYAIDIGGGNSFVGNNVSQGALSITPTINQTGSSSYTALLVNPTETAIGSGTQLLMDLQVGGSSKFKVSNNGSLTLASGATINTLGSIITSSGGLYSYYNPVASYQQNMTTTPTDGLMGIVTTSATAGVPVRYSPRLRLAGTAWDTGASSSKNLSGSLELITASGNPVSSYLRFGMDPGTGTYSYPMVITSAGNVGIGTTSPSSALEVNGNLKLSSGGGQTVTTPGTELVLEQTGDSFGSSKLRLRNRNGSNGAIFESSTNDLVDFGFIPSSGSSSQNNLRMEHRPSAILNSNNTGGEFQFFDPNSSSQWFASGKSATIVKTGNVGIGTSSPNVPLEVNGNANEGIRVTRPNNSAQYIAIDEYDGSIHRIRAVGDKPFNFYSNSITFGINFFVNSNTQALSILSNGNVGIGATSPAYKLDVAGDINTSSCFRIGATTVSGTCTSDERLKEDIQDYTSGLSDLLNIKLHTYKFNGLGEMPKTGEVAVGVVAQEVEKTNPELVKTREVYLRADDKVKTEIKVVDYSKFSYMLINAVKELYQKWFDDHKELSQMKVDYENLFEKTKKLEVQNEELKARLIKLEQLIVTKKDESNP